MQNKYAPIEDYDYKMIEAYIDKDDVTDWYVNAFKKFNVNGFEVLKWNWSWWAFFGNIFYLLYRKAYLASFVVLVLTFLVGALPFGHLILSILTGGFAPYFVYKTYKEKKDEVEKKLDDENQRIESIKALGGANEWALWLGVIVHLFIWGFAFLFISAFLASIGLAFLIS